MRALVTGANGQLGYDIVRLLSSNGRPCRGVDIEELDITDCAAVAAFCKEYRPTHVIHCAAYTAVDRAESEKELCSAVNINGSENVALAAKENGAKLVYFSTDYVYGGEGDAPMETDTPTAPLNVYGRTKLAGERAAAEVMEKENSSRPDLWRSLCVIRTSWVFGLHGGNFVKTMIRLGRQREELRVVADQTGSPTYTRDLAELVLQILLKERFPAGVLHATNEGFCSWYEFADAIIKGFGVSCEVKPISSDEYPTAAKRPLNSRLSKASLDAAGLRRLPCWRNALARYFTELH